MEFRPDMQAMVEELLAFPRGRHDDLIDALAMQLDYLVPSSAGRVTVPEKEGTMRWWVKQLPEKEVSLYDAFLKDLKEVA